MIGEGGGGERKRGGGSRLSSTSVDKIQWHQQSLITVSSGAALPPADVEHRLAEVENEMSTVAHMHDHDGDKEGDKTGNSMKNEQGLDVIFTGTSLCRVILCYAVAVPYHCQIFWFACATPRECV